MAEVWSVLALGMSPAFPITLEEYHGRWCTGYTDVDGDYVRPPTPGKQNAASWSMMRLNRWNPWIDEKILEPKFDGVCEFLGIPSNQPTHPKDYHILSLMRATDAILQPHYEAVIQVQPTMVVPLAMPSRP